VWRQVLLQVSVAVLIDHFVKASFREMEQKRQQAIQDHKTKDGVSQPCVCLQAHVIITCLCISLHCQFVHLEASD
jgi:hypothetical protein